MIVLKTAKWSAGIRCGLPGHTPGKVEFQLGDMRLLLGEGTNLRYCLKGDKQPAKHQLKMVFEDESALFGSVQMYGGLAAFPESIPCNGCQPVPQWRKCYFGLELA